MQIDLENYQYNEGSELRKQVGGDHYSKLAIQPVEYINANKLTYLQGNVIKYVTRYKDKNGLQDLEKAKHYIDMLIELEDKKIMAYLGYKNIAFRKHMKEQERIRLWKEEQKTKRKKFREWRNITTTSILQLVLVALIIAFYGVFAMGIMAEEKGSKVGVGNFVMAVSYTDSYDDLVYVSNFVDCDHAMKYYNDNCTDAMIMMCQLEKYLYMPIGHNSDSSFDFEPTDRQSCGFVGTRNLNLQRINMERRDEDWINPPEPKMGYNGYFFELEEEDDG